MNQPRDDEPIPPEQIPSIRLGFIPPKTGICWMNRTGGPIDAAQFPKGSVLLDGPSTIDDGGDGQTT